MSFDPEQLGKAADGVARSPFAAGLFGALVTAMRGMPGASWRDRMAHVASGSFMAGFVGPGAAEWFGLSSQNLMFALAFLLGMFGLNISAAFWAYLKTAKVSDWLPWVTKQGSD
jgi:hypothetical protein